MEMLFLRKNKGFLTHCIDRCTQRSIKNATVEEQEGTGQYTGYECSKNYFDFYI